jgi:hypothetical protein
MRLRMEIERNYAEVVEISAPEFYRDPDFLKWLNNPDRHQATWHVKGKRVNEFSDLFFTYDGGEGSDSDMPSPIWEKIHQELKQRGVKWCVVWVKSFSRDEDPPVTFQCENCEKLWTEDECKWVTDFIQRFQRGDTFTDLECPECGALCF